MATDNPITNEVTPEVEAEEIVTDDTEEAEVTEKIDRKAKAEDLDRKYKASSQEAQDLKWTEKIRVDNQLVFKLAASDKTRADRLAKKRGYTNTSEMLAAVKKTQSSPDAEVEDIDAKLDAREAKSTLNSFIKEKGITKDAGFNEDFTEIYEDLTEGKKLNAEKAERYARIAYQEAKKTSKFAESYKTVQEEMKGAGAASMQGNRQSATATNEAKSFFAALKPKTPKDWYPEKK